MAGFGWGPTALRPGIEDWGWQHPTQAVICAKESPTVGFFLHLL